MKKIRRKPIKNKLNRQQRRRKNKIASLFVAKHFKVDEIDEHLSKKNFSINYINFSRFKKKTVHKIAILSCEIGTFGELFDKTSLIK